jgi:hypothetical protein
MEVSSDQQADPRALLYLIDHLAPGSSIERTIQVANTTTAVAHVVLYSSAASIDAGSFLGADGHTKNDLAVWTAPTPDMLEVPAGGTLTATVAVAVPWDAAPGERYGVVWAETRTSPPGGVGVTQVSRVGLRLYLSVGPGGAPAADFKIDSLTPARGADGRPVVVATVHNTGGRALDMNGTLQLLDGPGGLNAGPFPATLGTTLGIGATEPVTITLDGRLPRGPWDARIMLRSGLLERSARATIEFPRTGSAPPVPVRVPNRRAWHQQWLLLPGAFALGAGGLAALHRRRRYNPMHT